MFRRNKTKYNHREYGECHIHTHDDGTVIHSQRKYTGYGFTEYMMVGTEDGINNHYKRIQKSYHPSWYCGSWPKPIEISDGLYLAYPSHSESCE